MSTKNEAAAATKPVRLKKPARPTLAEKRKVVMDAVWVASLRHLGVQHAFQTVLRRKYEDAEQWFQDKEIPKSMITIANAEPGTSSARRIPACKKDFFGCIATMSLRQAIEDAARRGGWKVAGTFSGVYRFGGYGKDYSIPSIQSFQVYGRVWTAVYTGHRHNRTLGLLGMLDQELVTWYKDKYRQVDGYLVPQAALDALDKLEGEYQAALAAWEQGRAARKQAQSAMALAA